MSGRLYLEHEASGLRHYLDGKPVYEGDLLELHVVGTWVVGSYAWSFDADERPMFYMQRKTTDMAHGVTDYAPHAGVLSFALSEDAVLRWPETIRSKFSVVPAPRPGFSIL